MMNTAEKVIQIALSQAGYMEKSAAAYKKDKNIIYKMTEGAGSDNYTKYGKEMHDLYPAVMDFPAAWCDAFVDWCFYQAYGVANAKGLLGGNFDDYTPNSAQLYKNKGAYYKTPKVGDQIFFNNGTRISHTGLVYDVDANYVYTIEGNTSNGSTLVANGGMVCAKVYPLNYSRIDGYGRPKYDVGRTGYSKGEVIDVLAFVTKANTYTCKNTKLRITKDIINRNQPEYSVRDTWLMTKDGYASAYCAEGYVEYENLGKWILHEGYKWKENDIDEYNGKKFIINSDGYINDKPEFNSDGSINFNTQ